jgi:hypothetical protein
MMSKFALKAFEAKGDMISLLERLRQSIAPILIIRYDRVEAVLLRVEQYEELVRKLALDPVRWADSVIDRAIREAESESFAIDGVTHPSMTSNAVSSLGIHYPNVSCW